MTPRLGAIDCGTNSTRLLVADGEHEIERCLITTRLGEGVDSTGRLSRDAIDRTLGALETFKTRCEELRVDDIRAITTSAARDAPNSEELVSVAEVILGRPLKVLTPEEEGRLTYSGVRKDFRGSEPALVLDIGGGSTELIIGRPEGEPVIHSIQTGCVRLTRQLAKSDPYRPEDLDEAFAVVNELLTAEGDIPRGHLVGVGGTITTLAAIDLGITEYRRGAVHHVMLARDRVEAIFRALSLSSEAERSQNPSVPGGRSDVIVAGTIILLGVMRRFALDECLVSESDILDGIILDIAE